MTWLFFAFLGPILWAISTHFDKYLVEKYFKHGSTAVLMVFTAIIGLVILPFIWFFDSSVINIPLASMAVIATSGILYMGAMYFYLQALQSEEASTVAPFFQAAGIFGLILGYIVLGEKLTLPQIAGVLSIIAGATLLSFQFGAKKHKVKIRLVLLMLACAMALALNSLIFKFFSIQDDFWSTNFWSFVGQAVFGIVLMISAANRKQLVAMLRINTNAVLSINGANELINLGGGLGMRYALILAPIGVVQAISSTTPFFVLLFGIIISIFLPKLGREDLGRTSLIQKLVATVLVIIGVMLANGF